VNAGFVLDRVAEVSDAGKEGAIAVEDGEGEFGYGVDMMIYCERFFREREGLSISALRTDHF
jgi:hypothetical protein